MLSDTPATRQDVIFAIVSTEDLFVSPAAIWRFGIEEIMCNFTLYWQSCQHFDPTRQ
jgi:hypothetical protein